ncbi:CAAX amino terminal protease self-immunity [Paraliobacillus sp. PM-2]|uniref:CPBP family intramembrane glutamic endopeptidase n=1 Tax=Paraliobacillus sp. PM-2 TaxID=1462524 RepID=UPI00061BC176|nr:type II CAAX endopeptidase family protein [Paraliobacillus sp. PM-2]CQR47294.1 CAAX amino terminal protease self-immunity [Paraliobacillus sp. PM-2]
MKRMNKSMLFITVFVFTGCTIMAWVDAVWMPDYEIKSAIKVVLFLLLPISYALMDKDTSFIQLFVFKKKTILFPILLGLGVYVFIVSAYFLIGPFFDLSNITSSLESNIGVSSSNFVFVALYISFINSLLEEFFFRGFAFLSLKQVTSRKFAYLFSASLFSIYHVALMLRWFNIGLFILLIISLFMAGLLFNWLNEKHENIYTSWFVHMAANFAINTIGFILFDII